MRVLALDTTTRAGSVAVVDDGRVLVERVGDGSRTHAERLPAEILEAVASAGIGLPDIDLFAVASGPGSFTGLRIGIATIQGLAVVSRRRVAPVSALAALAQAAAAGRPAGARAAAWMDAHRRDVFSAFFEVGDAIADGLHTLTDIEPPMVGAPAETIRRWAALGLPDSICGDGASMYAELLPASVTLVPAPPLAGMIGRLAIVADAQGATVGPAGVQPLYVRRPDAEVARDAATTKR
jgi:tRNA threonylcarbamoyladenosine biosynthesis protein TsaB